MIHQIPISSCFPKKTVLLCFTEKKEKFHFSSLGEKPFFQLKLNPIQRQILVGILLGDAHLETQNNGKTYRLKYSQAIQHKEYLFHVYSYFKDWCVSPPKQRIRETEIVINGKVTSKMSKRYRWEFSTRSDPVFRFYGQQFYPKQSNKKRIPLIINRILTVPGLAFWYQDDGSMKSKKSKGLILNTQGFLLKDIERMCTVLHNKFNLRAKPRYQKSGYQIYISGHSFSTANFLLKDWLLPLMKDRKWPSERKIKNKSF